MARQMTEQHITDDANGTTDLRTLVDAGEHIQVHIPSTAPTGFFSGSDTEFDPAVVDRATMHEITGTDPNWGDTVRVLLDGKDLRMESGGKSGEVVRIDVFETTDDGVPIHGTETTVYETEAIQ